MAYSAISTGSSANDGTGDTLRDGAIKVFKNMQPGDVESTYASTQNLEDWISYRPLVTIKEGVNKFANWYLDFYI